MTGVVSLREVVEAIDLPSGDWASYLDPNTGEIVTVTDEDRRLLEKGDLDDVPEWQRDMLLKVRAALESDPFLRLPDRFEVHEWVIMERFSQAQRDESVRQDMLDAIHGPGAFRNFRGAIRRLALDEAWNRFRDGALEQIAREWLEAHNSRYK